MAYSSAVRKDVQLDVELCRAMFEKDPDRMIELVSTWLEINGLTTSDDFRVPDYLNKILTLSNGRGRQREILRTLVS